MSRFSAVLDACVLYPAALRDTLLRAEEADLYRGYWSEDILDEATRNLVADGRMSEGQAHRLKTIIMQLFPEAMVTEHHALIVSLTNDVKDRHVLAVAIASASQVIVTSNIRDFPSHALEPYGIEAQTPDEFLFGLYDLDPAKMARIIREQAADLRKPPGTPDTVLKSLRLHAPKFADAIQLHIEEEDRRQAGYE